jgi:pullulanase/glycogen debranching enzyme
LRLEGATDDPEIERLRSRQVKNFFTAAMLSVGVPMFSMGDEVRRTQRGNNNAYCQDNDTSWFDWNLLSKHADVLRFVKLLIQRRVMREVEHERWRLSLSQFLREAKHAWHGLKLNQPDWSSSSHSSESSTPFQCQRKFGNAPIVDDKNREFSTNSMCLGSQVKNLKTVLRNHDSIKVVIADHLKRAAARAYVKQHVAAVP